MQVAAAGEHADFVLLISDQRQVEGAAPEVDDHDRLGRRSSVNQIPSVPSTKQKAAATGSLMMSTGFSPARLPLRPWLVAGRR